MLASAVGTTILIALIGKSIDSGVELDALWAKNLTYFFGHSYANLIIYLGAGMIYVLLPRYAGRPWKTTRPLAYGWLATLLLVTTAYGHHLYMDFVQPGSGHQRGHCRIVGRIVAGRAVVVAGQQREAPVRRDGDPMADLLMVAHCPGQHGQRRHG